MKSKPKNQKGKKKREVRLARRKTNREKIQPFDTAINKLNLEIQSLDQTLPLIETVLTSIITKDSTEINSFATKFQKGPVKIDDATFDILHELIRETAIHLMSKATVREMYLVALITKFDIFLADLLRDIYEIHPEVLVGSEKKISYPDVLKYSSLTDVKENIISQEVDEFLRGSITDRFKFLEKISNVKIIEKIDMWPQLIEISERRNVIIHNNGIASKQYLEVCKANDVDISSIDLGRSLTIRPEYFAKACETFYEAGIITEQLIRRKILPKDKDKADISLRQLSYESLKGEKYNITIQILNLGKKLNDYSSEETKCMILINGAAAYKFHGDKAQCTQLIDDEDWSAKDDMYKLAICVLKDEFDKALKLMESIPSEKISEEEYKTWPLFNELRKHPHFQDTYKKKFGIDFEEKETIPKKLEALRTQIQSLQ